MKQVISIGCAGLCVAILILFGVVSGQPDSSDATRIAPKDDNIPQAVTDGSSPDEGLKNLLVEFDKKRHGALENVTPNATRADGTVSLWAQRPVYRSLQKTTVPSQSPKTEPVARTKTISPQAQVRSAQANGLAGYQAKYQDKINRLYAANGLPPPATPAVATDPSERRRLKEIWRDRAPPASEGNRRVTTSAGKPHVAENGSYYGEISAATARSKTVYVRGYYRNGTYVRSHYRSPPRGSNSIRAPPSSSRRGVAENGSYYGQISKTTGRPKTVAVRGYYRKNGTYVRGHYRSRPRR